MQWWVPVAAWVMVMSSTLEVVQGARVLFLGPVTSKSHKNFFMSIANALADNNNQVTMVSSYKPSKVRDNVREVVLPDIDIHDFMPNMFTSDKMTGPLTLMFNAPLLCSDALEKEEMQSLMEEDFDVIILSIFFSDCFLSVAHKMKVPLIHICPGGLFGPLTSMVANPSFPSFVGAPIFDFSPPLTFTQRAINTFFSTVADIYFDNFHFPRMEAECRRRGLCPDDMPSLSELRYNTSILIVNSVRTIEYPPRPIIPSVVYVGGSHCRPSQPLPQDLEEWVSGAGEDGFIFFSVGSAVIASSIPEEYRTILVQVFGSLKQRVLWKWDKDTMDDLPPNVRLSTWLPQQDILGDPRLRLFITHGGLLSTLESAYHGVPVLGMPVFGDQYANMLAVEREGWGRVLFWDQLTPSALKDMINHVMTTPRLWATAREKSVLMKDQPQDPAKVAAYWVEYVVRHKGAKHLRSPTVNMTWYELYNVDVWAFLIVVLLLLTYIFIRVILALCSWLFFSKPKPKVE